MKNQDKERGQTFSAAPPEKIGGQNVAGAVMALIEALECPERDGPFQAALDRAKAAMKGG